MASQARMTVLGLLYPRACALCHEPLAEENGAEVLEVPAPRQGLALCPACREIPRRLEPPFCTRCAEPLGVGVSPLESAVLCPSCQAHTWRLDGAVCAFRGTDATWELVHSFKYNRETHLATVLGWHLRHVLLDERLQPAQREFSAIVPVPLFPARERERGFNQARLLAEQLAPAMGVPVRELLRRRRETGTQTRLTRAGRLANLRGAFSVRGGTGAVARHICGRNLLLIDDVLTTGSTLDECARTLKAAGAGEVWAATVIRAGGS